MSSAGQLKHLGDSYMKDGLYDEAFEAYSIACKSFDEQNDHLQANICRADIANILVAQIQCDEELQEAIKIYEELAQNLTQHPNSQSSELRSAEYYLLCADLCRLALGATEIPRLLTVSETTIPEICLLKAVVEAIKESDSDKYTNAVIHYDSLSKLSPLETSLLLKIKIKIAKK